MSWFETVKNIAKTVAENASAAVTQSIGSSTLSGISSAVPINHSGFWSVLSRPSADPGEESSESESDSERHDEASGSTAATSQVTTRARFTYELDRNAAKAVVITMSEDNDRPSVDKGSFSIRDRLKPNARIDDNETSSESETSEYEGNVAVYRITTRARITYELDRFQKNALLMFVQMRGQPPGSSRIEESTTQDINILMDTLKGFRFEVNTHIYLTCSEIENKCQEFFQQNFTEYGAVIVVVLTFSGNTGKLSALDGQFSESIMLRHFIEDLNPTLLDKPKIYITEASRIISSESGPRLSLSLEGYHDVLGLHLPTIEYQSMIRRPLMLLCDNIKNMADSHDFAAILKKSVEDIETENSIFEENPIEYNNKFTKEMILARS